MPEQNALNEYHLAVSELAEAKFVIATTDTVAQNLLGLLSDITLKRSVLRLKRARGTCNNYKTILFAELQNMGDYDLSLKWVAYVKDELLGPESSDLYLILHPVDNSVFSVETCINIEASESYCRKFVRRPNESIEVFWGRTFLSRFSDDTKLEQVVDPLQSALAATAETHPQFSSEERSKWRELFLSGESGIELIDKLFENSTQTPQHD